MACASSQTGRWLPPWIRTNIVISEYTKAVPGKEFYCRFLDLVRVKGKDIPVRIYEPLCEGEPAPELKKETEAFAEALDHYANRDFQEAGKIILALNEAKPSKLYALHLDRFDYYYNSPPPPDWDGSFTFTSK